MKINVLSIGYYDDFARFFLKIKEELASKKEDISFHYLSVYASGFLFWFLRSGEVSLLTFKVMLEVFKNKSYYKHLITQNSNYKGVSLSAVIKYHESLGISSRRLKIRACGYIDVLLREIEENEINLIICSSDSRLVSEVIAALAKNKGIKVLYFEQGPHRTTFLDEQGVNANVSIRGKVSQSKNINNDKKIVSKFIAREKGLPYKRNPFYRGVDYLLELAFSKTLIYPDELKNTTNNTFLTKFRTVNKSKVNKILEGETVFLLILQVPFDANMVHHSPHFKSHYEIVKSVVGNLPTNGRLIVREHPLYKSMYEKEIYKLCKDKGIYIQNDISVASALKNADVIIVNNSTVGLEAISEGKPTVVLGDALYDSSGICLRLDNIDELKELLETAPSYQVDESLLYGFLTELYFNNLLKGHFRDENLDNLVMQISNRLKEHYVN
jgi:capsular polysaccharide export protein